MLAYCSYQGCINKNVPFSSLTFFTIPKDHRRQIWIENSGNPQLKNIGPNAVRNFCEKHFNPADLKRQFNRTILYKTAVPYKYNPEEDIIKKLTKDIAANVPNEKTVENVQSSETPGELPEDEIEDFDSPDTIEVVQEQDPNDEEFEHVEYMSQEDEEQTKKYSEDEQVINILYECDTNSEDVRQQVNLIEVEESRSYSRKHRNISPDRAVGNKKQRFIEDKFENPKTKKCYQNKPTSTTDQAKDHRNPVKASSATDYEEDKHFALSLVGYFQRLPMKKKAFAKLKILRYLTELEYEDEAKL